MRLFAVLAIGLGALQWPRVLLSVESSDVQAP